MGGKRTGYVFDGPAWDGGAYTFVTFLADTERIMRQGAVLTADEVDRLTPESQRDIARWLSEGSIHKTATGGAEAPAEVVGKE